MGVPDFKKATPKGAPSRISGSDAKKLRAEAAKTLRATDASIDALLPKNAVYEMVKMSNRAVVYLVDGQPMFFDGSGRWELFPTVYALWAIGASSTDLTTVRTHSLVSPKVLGGAALMLPRRRQTG
jgi:predicted ribosome-associated RNA-binding protein Tma20